MKALVTGGTGFVGSHVVELLLEEGWEVVCPVRDARNLRNLSGVKVRIIPFEGIEQEARRTPGFNFVIHAAGATRGLNYEQYRQANVEGTRSLLEILARLPLGSTFRRFVLVGSQAAAGPCAEPGVPVAESDNPRPVSLYGKSKLEAERVVLSFACRLPVTIVRPSTVFGPKDRDVLGVFRCAQHGFSPYLGGPDRLFSVIYVEDLARGIREAATAAVQSGETYFLANKTPVSWREFTGEVARVMGCRTMNVPIPLAVMRLASLAGEVAGRVARSPQLLRREKFDEMKQSGWVCSTEKAKRELNWEAQTPLHEALRKTVGWYRATGWL